MILFQSRKWIQCDQIWCIFATLENNQKYLAIFERFYFLFDINFNLLWHIFVILGKLSMLFMDKYWKPNLTIWSHYQFHLNTQIEPLFQTGQTLGASSLILSGHKPTAGPASLVSLAGLLTQADAGGSPSPSQRTQMQKSKLSLSIPTATDQPIQLKAKVR